MLKRFTVENFASFKGEQSLDMTASRTEVLPDHVTNFSNVKLLKSAVIYGANASGKSNLIKAIDYAKKIITKGLNDVDTYNRHFRLDDAHLTKKTTFEFEVELQGLFYSYGFSSLLKEKEIQEEWLYEIGKAKPNLIFQKNGSNIEFGSQLRHPEIRARFDIYKDDMKNQKSQLFLTEIADKELEYEGVKIFNALHNWFDEKLIVLYPESRFSGMGHISNDHTDNLSKYLCKFDTGIVDIESIDEDFDSNFKNMPEEFKAEIEAVMSKKDVKEIYINDERKNYFITVYKDISGDLKVKKLGLVHGKTQKHIFELKDESDGTKRLLDFIPLINKFSEDFTIIIDEFDRSLHPKLTKEFFELFYKLNKSKSQFIVTTHESTLLDLELLRRDEIWFVEKNDEGMSNLFSLNKFKIRYDSKIEKAYLLGRYGAVPIFKLFDEIDRDIENGV
ncbi:AAA family ATPase [Cognaticolwellia beringensis]|uniref:ATPase AAA-type core domain-containing protein n=1 Tax=Cognaticolwellia beringensis TaxID=1967665 RepID=A0A222GB10_9GAMM|nr:ATP-binding protein [Cognaticolwellia beringensis]ASP48554.1 hypothetical protein B5D82_12715 [Cognaticolwellia beringensis]